MSLRITVLPDALSVCRLPADSPMPAWAESGRLRSVCWTPHETSIVCAQPAVPDGVASEDGWRALAVEGPLDFGLTGVLAALAEPLADAGISIFAISTYDTDYVLVREDSLDAAIVALASAGHHVERQGSTRGR